MISSNVGHLVFGIDTKNVGFYKELLTFLGWQVIYEDSAFIGCADNMGISMWFGGMTKNVNNDYDGPGLNHLALSVPTQANVDETVAYLAAHNITNLFDTPRHRPEFAGGPDNPNTYYQVMFESPDRILFEVVYTGPK
jgi:catechol 2,3-dioxygenase-like lactoylglutathione lyase family enzyme